MIQRLFVLIIFFFLHAISAQSRIDRAIDNLERNYSQEKVYLLLDKSNYLNGENIWFKSFVFDGYQLSSISTTLFVELYDQDKKLMDKKTILLKDGQGNGSFALSNDLAENVYYIRAYTPWMTNFPEEFQSIQPLLIYNPDSPKKLALLENQDWEAHVFPEGGKVIEDVPTKFSVRLISPGAAPKSWSGYVINTEKPSEKLSTFKNLDENVALFNLTPKKNSKYQVILEDGKGKKKTLDLPEVLSNGVSLQLTSNEKGIQYIIKGINLTDNLKNYRIVGTINDQLAYSAAIVNPLKEFSYTIPANINEGLNGVLRLVVFDDQNKVVAERLAFIKPDQLQIKTPVLEGLPLSKTPRGKNQFDILKTPNFTDYAVSVRNISNDVSEKVSGENNLLSTLWLTGDFTSNITNPAQYFSGKKNTEALDALLISEKWKRFDWADLVAGKAPTIKTENHPNLSFKGKLALNSRALTKTSVNLLLQSGDANSTIFQAMTDESGNIYLNDVAFDEPLQISYFLNVDEAHPVSVPENLTLRMEPLVESSNLTGPLPLSKYQLTDRTKNDQLPPNIAKAVINKKNKFTYQSNETLIEEVFIKAQKKDASAVLNKKLATGLFSSMNAQIFDLVNENTDAVSYASVFDWLQGRVAGLTFSTDDFGNKVPKLRGGVAKLYLDENPTDAGLISGIPVSEIAMIKVFKGSFLGEAIVIYMKKGGLESGSKTKEISKNRVTVKTYDKAEPFVQPNFSSESYKNITADTREVLYWNSTLIINSNAENEVQFYNNDSPQNFKITIISFSKEGSPMFYEELVK